MDDRWGIAGWDVAHWVRPAATRSARSYSGKSPARSADVALGRAAWRSAVVLWDACSIRHPNARCAPAATPTPAPVSGAGSERRCRSARRVGRAARRGRACCSPPRRSRLPPAGIVGTGCDRWRRWRSRIPGSPRSRLRAPGSAARSVSVRRTRSVSGPPAGSPGPGHTLPWRRDHHSMASLWPARRAAARRR